MASGIEKNTGNTGTPRENMRGLRILVAALSAGVLIFALICVVITQVSGPLMDKNVVEYKSLILPVMTGLAIIAILIAHTNFGKQIRKIREISEDLNIKLERYRVAVTKYMAICEGMAIFSILFFYWSGQYTVLIFAALFLGLMLAKLLFDHNVVWNGVGFIVGAIIGYFVVKLALDVGIAQVTQTVSHTTVWNVINDSRATQKVMN